MGSEWEETTLGEFLTLQRGFDLPESQREPGPYPVIASTGQVGAHFKAIVKGPGVVIGRSGSLGGGQYITSDFWPLNTTLWVKDFKGNDKRFCYYLLKSLDLARFNVGSGVPTLNRNHIHPLPITVPADINEQKAIAHILGTLDDKTELNRRMSSTLEEMARAIFKSWFIDFEPVRAKAEVRRQHPDWTNEQVSRVALPTLDQNISGLFPDDFEDSELGEIPKGWRVGCINDLADVVGGSTPSTKEPKYWEGGIHFWATPKDLSILKFPVLLDTERCITDAGLSQISSGLLPVGTVLMSSRAPIGYLSIAEVPVAINQGFIAMKPQEFASNLYLLFWAYFAQEEILSRANGSTFLEVNKANFRKIPLVLPRIEFFKAFDFYVEPLYKKIISNEREVHTLGMIKAALLPKLISGDLRVKDVDRFFKNL